MAKQKIGWIGLLIVIFLLIQGMVMISVAQDQGNQIGKALIVVDPGFSKASLKVGQSIAAKLTQKGVTVKLVTVKSFKPQDFSGIDLLVLGGPTYVGQPSGGLKKLAAKLNDCNGLKTLLFQTGGADCSGLGPLGDLAKTQGLTVIGSYGFLPQDMNGMETKINKLLEAIQ
jgi:flavorubredoxin